MSSKPSKPSTRVLKKTTVVPEIVVTEPVVSQPTLETPTPLEPELSEYVSVKLRLETMVKSKQDSLVSIKQDISELKKLMKDLDQELKNASKKNKKRKTNEDGSVIVRKPSGFASPVLVSDQLYDFLSIYGIKKSDPIARTDVTRYITTYIKENNLQNPKYRREIIADDKLRSILGEPFELKDKTNKDSEKVYTYLQLQKYLSHHFPAKTVVSI